MQVCIGQVQWSSYFQRVHPPAAIKTTEQIKIVHSDRDLVEGLKAGEERVPADKSDRPLI